MAEGSPAQPGPDHTGDGPEDAPAPARVAEPAGETDGSSEAVEQQHEITVEQLASVHALLSRERAATFHDILITTALEALAGGPLTEAELVADALRMWPRTGVDAVKINAAMRVAAEAGYVSQLSQNREIKWALTKLGVSEQVAARDWAKDILVETARQVQSRLAEAGRQVSAAEARLWTSALRQALMAGIAGAFAPYTGEVQQNGQVLTVRKWDRDAIRDVIDQTAGSEHDAELMFALAIDAFDPLSPFGNEMVSAVITGYMLHAFVGRRDRVAARAVVGSLNGVRAVLDTPVLLRLVGPPELAMPIERVVASAIGAGMEVVAPVHYIEELNELVATTEAEHVAAIEAEIKTGVDADSLSTLVDDGVISQWLRALVAGKYRNWAEFRAAVGTLPQHLTGMGVVVRPHYNTVADKAVLYEEALAAEIAKANARRRKKAVLERDGETMAMVHRKRERTDRAFWPGAWIITSDTRIGPAYAGLNPRDQFPATLTPAAWVSILSNCSEPAEVGNLAAAASQLFGEEGFLTIAARFPIKTAVDIARALSPTAGGSSLDVRVAQGLDELLRAQPDYDALDDQVGARLAAEVVTRRSVRMNHTYTANARQQAEREERMAQSMANQQRQANEKDKEARRLAAERDEAEAGKRDALAKVDEVRLLERRRTKTILGGLGVLGIALLLFLNGAWLAGLVAFACFVWFYFEATEWLKRVDASGHRIIASIVAQAIVLVIGLITSSGN